MKKELISIDELTQTASDYILNVQKSIQKQISILEKILLHENQNKTLVLQMKSGWGAPVIANDFSIDKVRWDFDNKPILRVIIRRNNSRPDEFQNSNISLAHVIEVNIIEETKILDQIVKVYTKIS